MRIELLELPNLSVGSPAQVAIPRVPQIGRRDLLETARRVEASGKLVGNRLVVYEAVFVRGADGLLVQFLSVQHAASIRAISAPTRAARSSNVSGLTSAHTSNCR